MYVKYVKLLNDVIKIDTGMDWVAIIALIFTILSTIGILLWQNHLRKLDIKLQQWNALYPHRLEFYKEFYDFLTTLTNYKKDVKDGYAVNNSPIVSNFLRFYSTFKKFQFEVAILFENQKIIVENVELIEKNFEEIKKCPSKDKSIRNIEDLQKKIEGNQGDAYRAFFQRVEELQNIAKQIKNDVRLQNAFKIVLKYENSAI